MFDKISAAQYRNEKLAEEFYHVTYLQLNSNKCFEQKYIKEAQFHVKSKLLGRRMLPVHIRTASTS